MTIGRLRVSAAALCASCFEKVGTLDHTVKGIALESPSVLLANYSNTIRRYNYPALSYFDTYTVVSGGDQLFSITADPSTGDIWYVTRVASPDLSTKLWWRDSSGSTTLLYTEANGTSLGRMIDCRFNPVDGKVYVTHRGSGSASCTLYAYAATTSSRLLVYTGGSSGGVYDFWDTAPIVLSDGSVVAGTRGNTNDLILRITTGGAVSSASFPDSGETFAVGLVPDPCGMVHFVTTSGNPLVLDPLTMTTTADTSSFITDSPTGYNNAAWTSDYSLIVALALSGSGHYFSTSGAEIWQYPCVTYGTDTTLLIVLASTELGDPLVDAPGFARLFHKADRTDLGYLALYYRQEATSVGHLTSDGTGRQSVFSGQAATVTVSPAPNGAPDVTVNFSTSMPYAVGVVHCIGVPAVVDSGDATVKPFGIGGITGSSDLAIVTWEAGGFLRLISETTTPPSSSDIDGTTTIRMTDVTESFYVSDTTLLVEHPFATDPTFNISSGNTSFVEQFWWLLELT